VICVWRGEFLRLYCIRYKYLLEYAFIKLFTLVVGMT
jgi:hypothetical protein